MPAARRGEKDVYRREILPLTSEAAGVALLGGISLLFLIFQNVYRERLSLEEVSAQIDGILQKC